MCGEEGADLEVVHCLGRPPCLVQLLDNDRVEGMRRLSSHLPLVGDAKDAPCGPGSQGWGCCCCCCRGGQVFLKRVRGDSVALGWCDHTHIVSCDATQNYFAPLLLIESAPRVMAYTPPFLSGAQQKGIGARGRVSNGVTSQGFRRR